MDDWMTLDDHLCFSDSWVFLLALPLFDPLYLGQIRGNRLLEALKI